MACNFISAYQPCAKPVSQDALKFKGISQNWLLRSQISWFNVCQVTVQQLFKELNLFLLIFKAEYGRAGHEFSHKEVSSSTFLNHIFCVKRIDLFSAVFHFTQKPIRQFYFILLGCLGAKLSELKQKVVSENPQEYGVAVPRE